MGAIDHQGVTSLDPRGLIDTIYVGDQHTLYISCKIFKKKFFLL